MAVFYFVLVVVAGLTVVVDSFPSGHIVFPEDTNAIKASVSGHERFHHGYRPDYPRDREFNQRRPDYYGYYRPGPRPGSRVAGSAPTEDFSPFSRPGGDARGPRPNQNSQPQNLPGLISSEDPSQEPKPFGNPSQVPQPLEGSQSSSEFSTTNSETTGGFQPEFLEIDPEASPGFSGPGGSISSSPDDTTTPEAVETTTKIPRRDPTNRIVYTVTCPCTHTFQYKPVCGTDGQTYGNIGVLLCAQKCGSADVKVFLDGSCGRNNGHPGAISLKY